MSWMGVKKSWAVVVAATNDRRLVGSGILVIVATNGMERRKEFIGTVVKIIDE